MSAVAAEKDEYHVVRNYGIINEDGDYIVEPIYKNYEMKRRENGVFIDVQSPLFVTSDGEILYDEAAFPEEVRTNEPDEREWLYHQWENITLKDGDLCADGKKIVDADVMYFAYKCNGMFAYVTRDEKVGLFNDKGELVAEPVYMETTSGRELPLADFYWFSKDGYAVCIGEKENYLVNKKGECVLNLKSIISRGTSKN